MSLSLRNSERDRDKIGREEKRKEKKCLDLSQESGVREVREWFGLKIWDLTLLLRYYVYINTHCGIISQSFLHTQHCMYCAVHTAAGFSVSNSVSNFDLGLPALLCNFMSYSFH